MSIKLNRFAACAILFIAPVTAVADWTFTDVSESAGAAWRFELVSEDEDGGMEMAGGVAAGDYDRDGDTDLYVMTGDISPNALLRNDGGNAGNWLKRLRRSRRMLLPSRHKQVPEINKSK